MIFSLADWTIVSIIAISFLVFIISLIEGIRGEIEYQEFLKGRK